MARKKVTHEAKHPKVEASQPQDLSQNHHDKPMDDPSEKLQNLKSLNSMLLKETFDRRQQVESLEHAKESLEAELTRSGMEQKLLEAELARASEQNVGLELEKSVVYTFWETQMGELGVGFDGLVKEKSEIEKMKLEREAKIGSLENEVNELMANLENERERLSGAYQERDLLKPQISRLVDEANELRDKVVEMGKKERKTTEEVQKLKKEVEGALKEKLDLGKEINALKREKESVERNLEESARFIESLRSESEGLVREKGEVERKTSMLEVKIGELEKGGRESNETVVNLRKEKEVLRSKVMELEKSIDEAMDKEKKMAMEINILVEEKREKEQKMEKLKEERDSVQRILDMTSKESEFRQQRIEELIREKNEIEEVKLSLEGEIVELKAEIGRLRTEVSTLQDSCRDKAAKNNQLVSEVSRCRDALDRLTLERDEVQKGFDEENKKVKNMQVLVSEKEKRIQETVEELGRITIEHENLIERSKAMEKRLDVLVKEKDLVQKDLSEAQRGIDDLRAKMESVSINSERALSMVKKTAVQVCQSLDDRNGNKEVVTNEKKLEEEIQPYVVELNAINSAFRDKEKMVEDMKKQLEMLQNSVAEAHKQKSFWTVVSSATTIVAAASVAYVARGR